MGLTPELIFYLRNFVHSFTSYHRAPPPPFYNGHFCSILDYRFFCAVWQFAAGPCGFRTSFKRSNHISTIRNSSPPSLPAGRGRSTSSPCKLAMERCVENLRKVELLGSQTYLTISNFQRHQWQRYGLAFLRLFLASGVRSCECRRLPRKTGGLNQFNIKNYTTRSLIGPSSSGNKPVELGW